MSFLNIYSISSLFEHLFFQFFTDNSSPSPFFTPSLSSYLPSHKPYSIITASLPSPLPVISFSYFFLTLIFFLISCFLTTCFLLPSFHPPFLHIIPITITFLPSHRTFLVPFSFFLLLISTLINLFLFFLTFPFSPFSFLHIKHTVTTFLPFLPFSFQFTSFFIFLTFFYLLYFFPPSFLVSLTHISHTSLI